MTNEINLKRHSALFHPLAFSFRASLLWSVALIFNLQPSYGAGRADSLAPIPCVRELASQAGSAAAAPAIEAALRAADWTQLYGMLGQWQERAMKEKSSSSEWIAPARLLFAHAALACGKNDEAARSFYSLPDEALPAGMTAFDRWRKWTERLVVESNETPISFYLHGDALVRVNSFIAAHAVFQRLFEKALGALEGNPSDSELRAGFMTAHALGDLSLVLSGRARRFSAGDAEASRAVQGAARTVVPPSLGDTWIGDAMRYNSEALRLAVRAKMPAFTDGHNSIGVYLLLSGGSPRQARESFSRASAADGRDSMAINGIAFAMVLSGAPKKQVLETLDHADPTVAFINFNRTSIAHGIFSAEQISAMRGGFTGGSITGGINLPGGFGGNIGIGGTWNDRGGAFAFLSEEPGGNFAVIKGANTPGVPLGHWITLNYPML